MCGQYYVELRTQVGGGQGGGGTSAGSGSSAQQQAARRVTRMCMTIATTFSVSWLPYQLNVIAMLYGSNNRTVTVAVLTLTHLNSCVNPIIYALMWRPFRLSLIQVSSHSYR